MEALNLAAILTQNTSCYHPYPEQIEYNVRGCRLCGAAWDIETRAPVILMKKTTMRDSNGKVIGTVHEPTSLDTRTMPWKSLRTVERA